METTNQSNQVATAVTCTPVPCASPLLRLLRSRPPSKLLPIPVPTRVSPQLMPLFTRSQRRAKFAERAQAGLAALSSRAVRPRGRGRPENNPAAWAPSLRPTVPNVAADLKRRLHNGGRGTSVEINPLDKFAVGQRSLFNRSINVRDLAFWGRPVNARPRLRL